MLFAEEIPFVGGSPGSWSAAVILSSVLAWVFGRLLPAKDAQVDKMMSAHAAQVTAMMVAHAAQLEAKDTQAEGVRKAHSEGLNAKDAQIMQLIDGRDKLIASRDALIQQMADKWQTNLEKTLAMSAEEKRVQRGEYLASIKVVTDHCEKETSRNMEENRITFNEVKAAITDLRETMEEFRMAYLQGMKQNP